MIKDFVEYEYEYEDEDEDEDGRNFETPSYRFWRGVGIS